MFLCIDIDGTSLHIRKHLEDLKHTITVKKKVALAEHIESKKEPGKDYKKMPVILDKRIEEEPDFLDPSLRSASALKN